MRPLPLLVFLGSMVVVPHTCAAQGFSVGIELPNQAPIPPAVEHALAEMGIDYVNFYLNTSPAAGDVPFDSTLPGLMDMCKRLKLDFSIAAHAFEPPEEALRQASGLNGDEGSRFEGVLFDELAHVAVLNHFGLKGLVDSNSFQTLDEAYAGTLEAYRGLVDKYGALGATLTATHVFPVLLHLAARAGAVPCPKICKEFYSPVSLAIGMGAAKQYGRPLWVDCDLWYWDLIPGHDADELRSNLLLAYWLGADRVYLEGAGYNLKPSGHAGIPFSLMTQPNADTYQLTAHGEVLRWFAKEYVPNRPRPWSFRDVRPRVAIIRFEDTCFGQRYTTWPDSLYGSGALHSDADTEAWFALWNLLTAGRTGRDGLTFFKVWVAPSGYERPVRPGVAESYLSRPVQADTHRFFVPLTGTVVYDHTVGYELLADVPLIVLTGKRLSEETLRAVRRRVSEGATCLAWAPLARRNGFTDAPQGVTVIEEGAGKWVLTDDFGFGAVFQHVWQWIGHPDEIRYRFSEHDVVLRRVTDNQVAVEVDGKAM